LTLTGSLPWLVNNVDFVLSVEKRLTKPNLLSYCCIIPKDSDISIKLSLTEHVGLLISPNPTRKETSSEARQGRPRFQQHRDASCHQVLFFLQGKVPNEIQAILTETLVCFLPGLAKNLSAPL